MNKMMKGLLKVLLNTWDTYMLYSNKVPDVAYNFTLAVFSPY